MIVDTSALIAILRKEQRYQSFIETLLKADRVRISAATLLESRMVAHRDNGLAELAELLVTLDAEIIAVDQAQTDVAFQGFLRYGKGQHPAGLNFGDCFSYALAKVYDEPLLFEGNDFPRTDIDTAI
ncbi:MAG: PIN domain-containing protein [Gammaproteobacteria bacterium]|jgi:ribonuclease VapC|nr:PIN domain-containing protein [Gammaproteobacteria bacterium]